MRLFIALDIPAEVRERLNQYVERVCIYAPDARWARTESLHVTLKFIGEVSDAKVQEIKARLAEVKAGVFEIDFKEIGFFPNPRSPRVFWTGVNAPDALKQLASAVEGSVEKVGIPREKRAYHAHLTLARAPEGGASRHCFRLLQERLNPEPPPQFGTMTAREFFLYQSQIMRGGARYTKLQRFAFQ
ncbi:MAG TPA: RNA 2',3'-cyclic phosphodiesterase [Candidatus Angelobacter sp.]